MYQYQTLKNHQWGGGGGGGVLLLIREFLDGLVPRALLDVSKRGLGTSNYTAKLCISTQAMPYLVYHLEVVNQQRTCKLPPW